MLDPGPRTLPHGSGRPWGPLPGRVAAVGEGQVAHAQVVESPQDAQAAVNGVAALHADETGYPPLLEGLPDACEDSQLGAARGVPGLPKRAPLSGPGLGWGGAGAPGHGLHRHPPVLFVTHTKVSGYIWHMRWMTSICSRILLTASLFWVSQGVYADQNWGPRGEGRGAEVLGPLPKCTPSHFPPVSEALPWPVWLGDPHEGSGP